MRKPVIPFGLIKIDIVLLFCKIIGSVLNGIVNSIDIPIPLIGGFLSGIFQAPFKLLAFIPNLIGKLFWPFAVFTIILIIVRIIGNRRRARGYSSRGLGSRFASYATNRFVPQDVPPEMVERRDTYSRRSIDHIDVF